MTNVVAILMTFKWQGGGIIEYIDGVPAVANNKIQCYFLLSDKSWNDSSSRLPNGNHDNFQLQSPFLVF